ncbi:MAG: type II toxin-antitoxin system VapC family toxin [Acidimicrobiia bacterium]|nr:type II toxin-antitoxin system VapC family toxin [Acidimicrobiia bacterium]
MALVYFDSSALVKLVVDEPGTDLASALWDGCDAPLSSRLAFPEVRAALAASHRNSDLTDDELHSAQEMWDDFWAAVRPIEFTSVVEQRAGELAGRRALRGADAVHLASALVVGSIELVVAVWDRRLRAGALAANLSVAPSTLDD